MKKHIIWSNRNLDIEDWKDYLEEEWEDITDENEQFIKVSELNDEYLDDERLNLDIQLDNPILVIADLGLWDGRRTGYKIINSGNIKDILYSEGDYIEWYCDRYNVRCIDSHHDGTNTYLYREIRDMNNIDGLLDKLYNGKEISNSVLNYYTKSIAPKVKNVYGW